MVADLTLIEGKLNDLESHSEEVNHQLVELRARIASLERVVLDQRERIEDLEQKSNSTLHLYD